NGTTTVAAVSGVATFSTLSSNDAGSFTLGVSDGALNPATSTSFIITPAAASKLVITTQPADTLAGQTFSAIVIQVQDAFDNVVTNDTSNIVVALASGNGTLNGSKTIPAVNGVATFT